MKYVVNSGEVHTIVDIARLSVKYRTVDELVRCIQRITASASDLHKDGIELCWLDNKFAHPSPVGYADVNARSFLERVLTLKLSTVRARLPTWPDC